MSYTSTWGLGKACKSETGLHLRVQKTEHALETVGKLLGSRTYLHFTAPLWKGGV